MIKTRLSQFFMLILIICLIGLMGCMDSDQEKQDLKSIALTIDDVEPGMEAFSEDHVTEPYVVEKGKMFEGMLVLEKYEIVFTINASYFLVQQLAEISNEENATVFLDTLTENDTIPGLFDNYVFTSIPSKTFGEQSVLKTTETNIDGNQTQLYLLVFRKDATVCILVSGTLEKETLLSYASLLENRLLNWEKNK